MTDTKEAERFAGTWTLDECYSDKPSGRENLPLGKHVLGRINYDRDGHMAAQLMGDERTPFSSRDPREVTDSEYRAAFQTYTAYFGSYEINTEHNTVTHHVEGATVPNWPGMDQVRYYEFEQPDKLILRTPPMRGNDGEKAVHTLIWRRVTPG